MTQLGTLLVAAIGALLLCSGCGHRAWPKPVASQDAFDFASSEGRQDGPCLNVEATLTGDLESLDRLFLQIEEIGENADCPECPFVPRTRVDFELSDRRVQLDGDRLALRYCGVKADTSYRFRLAGVNVHSTLGEVMTPVFPKPSNPQ